MKIDERPSIVQMEPGILKNLVREVKETLATDLELPELKKTTLTFAGLWNIRRNARTAGSRFSR
ncbi:MAG: hypothetical protein ABIR30_12890 [Chitinophagaceae bacterium]